MSYCVLQVSPDLPSIFGVWELAAFYWAVILLVLILLVVGALACGTVRPVEVLLEVPNSI